MESGSADVRCFYGKTPPGNSAAATFYIPARYQLGNESQPWPFSKCRYAEEDFFLGLGLDPATGRPDWLGELFLWLSSSYEAGIQSRDDIGRIPYSETVFGRNGLSPLKPHASLLMAWLQNAIERGDADPHLPKAPSPVAGAEHLVVCSHDIDFYFTDRRSAFVRLAKNLVIALKDYRSGSYFTDNLRMVGKLLVGEPAGKYLPSLVQAARDHDFTSTLFTVARRGHRRDPDYQLDAIAGDLRTAADKGFSIGVHGSYNSVVEDHSLLAEAETLSTAVGVGRQIQIRSGRQHWLRFGQHKELFAEILRTGLLADSSLGFPDMVGFRNGAAFAFPPYDFEREAAHPFLEIPLVLMDGSLEATSRQSQTSPTQLVDQVLNASRSLGWGGVSILWHNPIEPLSVPTEINQVFWSLAQSKSHFRERWISVDQFLAASLSRYQQAGLLQNVRLESAPQLALATA